jgi:hypothetical protein
MRQPVLVIGAHKLEGEIRKLPKPFLIMQKQRKRKRPAEGEPVTPGGGGSSSSNNKRMAAAASGAQTPLSGGRGACTYTQRFCLSRKFQTSFIGFVCLGRQY